MPSTAESANPTFPATSAWQPSLPLSLVASLVGGLLGLGIIQAIHPVFPFEELPEMGMNPSAELMAQYHAAEHDFRSSNGALNCGILAGCLGLMIGLLTASNKRPVGGALGGVAGALSGAVGGYLVGHAVAYRLIQGGNQMLWESFAYHGAIWALSGAAISVAIAVSFVRKQTLQALAIGAVGGLIGAIAYNMVASILYPMANLVLILPDDLGQRAAWALSIALVLGLTLGTGFRSKPQSANSSQPNMVA